MVDVRARAAEAGDYGYGSPDRTIQTADFGVFIDFMSMFQPDDTTGAKPAYTKPAEQASFGRALRNIGLLYGHAGTVVFKMTKTPLPADGDADRVYGRRGWCHLERRLGDLEAPASNSLDVAAWPTAEAERAAREKLVRMRQPRRRSAGRRSCASRRRSSPRRATTSHQRPGHAGRADPRRRPRRAGEP